MTHSAKMKVRATTLARDGLSGAAIWRQLQSEYGEQVPHVRTVQIWVNPEARERARQRARKARRKEKMLARAEQLRLAGLPYSAIATVLNLDYGVNMSDCNVRYYMRKRGLPKDMRRATVNGLAAARGNLFQNRVAA